MGGGGVKIVVQTQRARRLRVPPGGLKGKRILLAVKAGGGGHQWGGKKNVIFREG